LSRDAGGRDTGPGRERAPQITADIGGVMPGIGRDDNTALVSAQPGGHISLQPALEYRLLLAKLPRGRKRTPVARRHFLRSAFTRMRFATPRKSGTLTAIGRIHISVHKELMRSDDTF